MRIVMYAFALLAFAFPASSSDPSRLQQGDVAFLGVTHDAPRPETIDANHLNAHQGVEINYVFPDSSAERIGIQEGDVILELNGVPIRNGLDLRTEIIRNIDGDPLSALIRRNGEDMELNGQFGSMGPNPSRQALNLDVDARYRAEQERRLQENQQALRTLRDEVRALEKEIIVEKPEERKIAEAKSDDPYLHRIALLQINGTWRLLYVIDSAAQ